MKSMEMGIEYVPRLAEHRHQHTLRVGICCEREESQAILDTLQQEFGNRTMMHRLRVPGRTAKCWRSSTRPSASGKASASSFGGTISRRNR